MLVLTSRRRREQIPNVSYAYLLLEMGRPGSMYPLGDRRTVQWSSRIPYVRLHVVRVCGHLSTAHARRSRSGRYSVPVSGGEMADAEWMTIGI